MEAIAVRSLYDVLAPSKEASQPAAPVVRLIDTGRASGAASSPAVPELQVMKSSHQAHLPEPARQPPEAAALPGAPEPKDGQAAETSGMAAIRRTPVGEMWGVARWVACGRARLAGIREQHRRGETVCGSRRERP